MGRAFRKGVLVGDEIAEMRWVARDDDGNTREVVVNATATRPARVTQHIVEVVKKLWWPLTFVLFRSADVAVVEDDDGWRATCACGTVVDLLALMPGIAHCQGASFELYVAREGYEPRRQKSFAELVQNTGLTDEERAVRAAKQKELDDVIAGVGEELLDEGPQRQPGFQEIVEVLRKFIPEEQRPWDSVDYEPAPEGAPFPEVPPGHVLDRPIYEEVHEPSIPPNVPDDVVPPPPVLNWESRVFRDLRTEYHAPIDHASAERLFPGPPPQSFEEAHIDPALLIAADA